jgi:hypothetical protein
MLLRCAAERRVGSQSSLGDLRRTLGRPLSDNGEAPVEVIRDLAKRADPGLVASAGPRYSAYGSQMANFTISVSNWSTTEAEADRSVDAILRAAGR